MDSSFEGAGLGSVKCSRLSMEKRREVVYEVAKWSHGAAEILQTWSRQDILQILCAEMGKERKYTGLTKLKIIEQLLKVVSEKSFGDQESGIFKKQSSPFVSQKNSKMPKKPENTPSLPASATNIATCEAGRDSVTGKYCKNAACKARLNKEDVFCKRCTCCSCHKYDDNKDPSLWLTCSSDPPFPGDSCNTSCHLECALTNKKSGIARNGLVSQLDGSFYCITCGKMNDLMSCWRKQLTVAKESRRVDILCYRIFLSQKLLSGTKKYRKLSEIVDDAVQKLEAEVGKLNGGPVKIGRGIVSRLSSGQEVQRLCSSAMESLDLMICGTPLHQDSKTRSVHTIRVETISDDIAKYSAVEKVHSSGTNWSSLSNPSSVEDETNNLAPCCDLNEKKDEDYFDYYKTSQKMVDPNSSTEPLNSSTVSQEQNPSCASDEEHATRKFGLCDQSDVMKIEAKFSSAGQLGERICSDDGVTELDKSDPKLLACASPETSLPITPSRKESLKDGSTKKGRPRSLNKAQENGLGKEDIARSSSKKRCMQTQDEECAGDGPSGSNLEYYIKVIRWLECEGHIDKSFRQKLLTWYSIRATPQETRIVKAFVDTLIEDPAALSEQLVDTFGELVSSKKSADVPHGFCLKLWH